MALAAAVRGVVDLRENLTPFPRPLPDARLVESGIEIIAGTPDIVIAIFGLVLFQQHIFAPLSFTATGNAVFGRSFLTAGLMMALIARISPRMAISSGCCDSRTPKRFRCSMASRRRSRS